MFDSWVKASKLKTLLFSAALTVYPRLELGLSGWLGSEHNLTVYPPRRACHSKGLFSVHRHTNTLESNMKVSLSGLLCLLS